MFEQMLQTFQATLELGAHGASDLIARAMIAAAYDFLWNRYGEVATIEMMAEYVANVRAMAAVAAEGRPVGVVLN